MSSAPPVPLTIRFTLSFIPDLTLLLPSLFLATTTPLSLLQTHIRPYLKERENSLSHHGAISTHPLRLISGGAILPPTLPLGNSLRLPTWGNGKGKGKEIEKEGEARGERERVWIHCSIGDVPLSQLQLDAEKASVAAAAATAAATHSSEKNKKLGLDVGVPSTMPTIQPQPQGFDRLLSAGLSEPEIASLRSQFLALQSHTHTPDTMPSPSQLRLLEERWLDSSTSPSTSADGGTNNEGGFLDGDTEAGALEDMLWGNVMGFFWAVGGVVWLVREEGVWSKRRQIAVVTGVLMNIACGIWRVGG